MKGRSQIHSLGLVFKLGIEAGNIAYCLWSKKIVRHIRIIH